MKAGLEQSVARGTSKKRKRDAQLCNGKAALDHHGDNQQQQSNGEEVGVEGKRNQIADDQLCETCKKTNFKAIFDGTRTCKTQPLRTLDQAVGYKSCPVCCFFVQVSKASDHREKPGDYSLASVLAGMVSVHRQKKGSLLRHDSELSFFTRSHGLGRLTQAEVRLDMIIRVSGQMVRREEVHDGTARVYLDRVEHASRRASPRRHVSVNRRAVPSQFDVRLLQAWLNDSDGSGPIEIADQPITASIISLISSGCFRVINVFTGKLETVRSPLRYVTLSYVWGDAIARYSQRRGKTGRVDATVLDEAPRTFRDAAALVRNIGESYLWIDAVSIDQLDPEDIHANISQMSAIYENAYLTVIAASGKDADAGLARLTSNEIDPEVPMTVATPAGEFSFLQSRTPFEEVLGRSTWASRAWTFQERSLSRKCVFFTEREVGFHCGSFEAREAYEVIRPLTPNNLHQEQALPIPGTRMDLYDRMSLRERLQCLHYVNAVAEFTRRMLTHPGDKLDAFAGIVERFYPRTISDNDRRALSGLTKRWFQCLLSWRLVPTKSWYFEDCVRIRHDTRTTRALPSWSWVAWYTPFGISITHATEHIGKPQPRWHSCVVVDAANIKCNLTATAWQVQPVLCEPVQPLLVTLHVWAKVYECRLEHEPSRYSSIMLSKPGKPEETISITYPTVVLWTVWPKRHRKIYLLELYQDSTAMHFLVIEGQGAFCERLGSGELKLLPVPPEQVSKKTWQHYSRKRYIALR